MYLTCYILVGILGEKHYPPNTNTNFTSIRSNHYHSPFSSSTSRCWIIILFWNFEFDTNLYIYIYNIWKIQNFFKLKNIWQRPKIVVWPFYYYHLRWCSYVRRVTFILAPMFVPKYSFNPHIGAWWNANKIRGSNFPFASKQV
jgi:hypothetical protein